MRKKVEFLVIVFFIIAITTPLLRINIVKGKASAAENRILASFPVVFEPATGKINANLFKDFESWMNDNIGFRDKAFSFLNVVNLKLFNITYPNEGIGKNNWLYLLTPDNILKVQNNNLIPFVDAYKAKFSQITNLLKSRGIAFTLMAFPYKTDIYPENLPDTILKINKQSRIEQIKDSFENESGFDFKVPLEPLFDAKKNMVIYSKAADNSHWNNYGAFIGYSELMKQVAGHIPNIKILTKDDFNITPYTRDTYRGNSLFTTETDYKFELKRSTNAQSDKSFFSTIGFSSADMYHSFNYFVNNDSSLPRAIVVGDSYVWMYMLPNMAESFSKLAFIHVADISQLPLLCDNLKPNIIICAGLDQSVLSMYNFNLNYQGAQIISEDTPKVLERGKKYNVNIEVKNTGTITWSEGNKTRLGIWVNGKDFGYRVHLPNGVEVKPGESYTFILYGLTANPKDNIIFEYQMLQEGVTYFGEKKRVDIISR